MKHTAILSVLVLTLLVWLPTVSASAADCPQWGGSPSRNNVSDAKNLPAEWNVGQFEEKSGRWLRDSAKNVRWAVRLGQQTYGTPVVAGGRVFCATSNAGYLKGYPETADLGCLVCLRESDGGFLWQLSREKLARGRELDWPQVGICDAPLVEGRRAWIVTNRCEVLCVDVEHGVNQALGSDLAPRESGTGQPKILWAYDMIRELGVTPHNMTCCSVTAAGDLLLVGTSHGVDESHKRVPNPEAPSFIALDKNTGKLLWADNSPGGNILHGQWSSPAFAVIGGVPQAVFAGGDGWVYSFATKPASGSAGSSPAAGGRDGHPPRPELLWKFDCNSKTSVWKDSGRGDRATLVATPMIYGDRVYIATGEDPEFGEAPGQLWCIDATKRGDVSPELVFDKAGQPAPPRRVQAADPSAGDVVRTNPKSAAVWHYTGFDANGDGKLDFKESMHRTLGMAVVKDDLLVIADLAGLVHCLDAKTAKVHWTYDMMSALWGTPLLADGKIFIGDEDGDVAVFELSPKLKLLAKNSVGEAVYTTPIAANGTLFVSTRGHLIAIGP
jgi:outer membrane protein assembly factor BamB